MLKRILIVLAIVIILAVCYGLWSFAMVFRYIAAKGGDYKLNLPNKYQLVRIYSECIELSAPNHRVILGPTIKGYRVYDNIVVGYVQQMPDDTESPIGKVGYFILDTKTGKLESGMSNQQWLKSLSKNGISGKVSLERPRHPNLQK